MSRKWLIATRKLHVRLSLSAVLVGNGRQPPAWSVKMPKRKRGAKEQRKAIRAPNPRRGEDSSCSELDEEVDELEFLQDCLAEGRAEFLSKMKL